MDATKQYLSALDKVMDLDCDIDKAFTVLEMLGDNSKFLNSGISKTDAMYLWYSHSVNANLYSICTDYLIKAKEELEKLDAELHALKNSIEGRKYENSNDCQPKGRSCENDNRMAFGRRFGEEGQQGPAY